MKLHRAEVYAADVSAYSVCSVPFCCPNRLGVVRAAALTMPK